MAVSQSNTMWVKKGTVVNGKKVKKGYVAQKGKPEKRVTGKINLVVDTDKRGKAGDTVQTKKGRYVVKDRKKTQVQNNRSSTGSTGGGDKPTTKPTTTDAPKDSPKAKGDRKATSATVSSATTPKSAPKPSLGGENKKFTPGREEPGQHKGNAKPKSGLEKIGDRGPHGTAADAAKAAGKGVGTFMGKYGPNSDWAKGKKTIPIGTVVTRGNPPKKYRQTKNGLVLVKKR